MLRSWNPLKATEKLTERYFDLFLTSFAPNNIELQEKLVRNLRKDYLWRGPYISITGQFKRGIRLSNFEKSRLHDTVKKAFSSITFLYEHQEKGILNILEGKNTIASIPTGSGKTEIFMIPILNYCFEHRGEPGIKAIIVYPMNSLANDQVERIRRILWILNKDLPLEKMIKFAIYVGDTPENKQEMKEGEKSLIGIYENCPLPEQDKETLGCSKECSKKLITYDAENETMYCSKNKDIVIKYQILTRDSIRKNAPDILITNYVQLEHLLLRKQDDLIFTNSRVKFLVLDEIHTYVGSRGIDVAFLIRRLRSRLKTNPICIGTSATLSTIKNEFERKNEIARFASNIFGVEFTQNDVIEGSFEEITFDSAINLVNISKIDEIEEITDLDDERIEKEIINKICKKIFPNFSGTIDKPYSQFIGSLLLKNPLFQSLYKGLKNAACLEDLIKKVKEEETIRRVSEKISDEELQEIIWTYLKLATMATHPTFSTPLINVTVHNFFKTIDRLYRCNKCERIYSKPKDKCDCGYSVEELGVCRFCGKPFVITFVSGEELIRWKKAIKNYEKLRKCGIDSEEKVRLEKKGYQEGYSLHVLPFWQTFEKPLDDDKKYVIPIKKCLKCGSILDLNDTMCVFCGSEDLREIYGIVKESLKPIKSDFDEDLGIKKETQPNNCPFCGRSYGAFSALSPIKMSAHTASMSLFDIVYTLLPEDFRKLLIFTDNRQAASYLAGNLEDGHFDHTIRSLLYEITRQKKRINLPDLIEEAVDYRINDWYGGNFDRFDINRIKIKTKVLEEIASLTGAQRSLENLGLIEINYLGLDTKDKFEKEWKVFSNNLKIPKKENIELWRTFLISLLDYIRTSGAMKGLERNRPGRDKVIGFSLGEEDITKKRVEIKGILKLSKTSKLFKIVQKSFDISDNNTLKEIVRNSFEFLRNKNYLICSRIEKWGDKAEGFVVNTEKILVKLPEQVLKCEKCQNIYTNVPSDFCPAYRCDGKVISRNYDSFLTENSENYYFKRYTQDKPLKMVTKEDTGALDLRERRDVENEFKKETVEGRLVDVIVATPTLELGVDIGDLFSVGLFKAPPSPVNYVQRIGRAGRKERISFNNTFLFPNPIDKFYYKNPEKLINGQIETPIIDIKNKHILQRHINSIILEHLLVHSGETYPYYMKDFSDREIEKLLSHFELKKREIKDKANHIFKDLGWSDATLEKMTNSFEEQLRDSKWRYDKEIELYRRYFEDLKKRSDWDNVRKVEEQIKKLENESLVSYLMEVNVLPRYAFPGILVEIKDEYGYEDFGGRSRNIAITEFAPLMEVALKKKIYKSTGIDLNILKPTRKIFYTCPNCQKYISDERDIFEPVCPRCKTKVNPQKVDCIEPNIIYVHKTVKSISEPRDYQEANSTIFFKNSPIEESMIFEGEPLVISKYGNIELVQIVDSINIEGIKYDIEICNECGRIKEKLVEEREHKRLGLGFGAEKCRGKFEKLALFHLMPTNVISIKLKSNATKLFGVDITQYDRTVFLTTLKNAIINAALLYTQALDGEIDGEVKGSEIILYDNVDGGAGYVDKILENFPLILRRAADVTLDCECEHGCLDCIWSYRRKKDISKIDKKAIEEVLKAFRFKFDEEEFTSQPRNDVLVGENQKTIHSFPYDFSGLIELRELLRASKEEIILLTDRFTDEKIPWPDEIDKSWVDILISKKLVSKENISIWVILKESEEINQKLALKKLLENGIEVYYYKDEFRNTLPIISQYNFVAVDSHLSSRKAIFLNSSFSKKIWENDVNFKFVTDERFLRDLSAKLTENIKNFQKVTKTEVDISNSIKSAFITPTEIQHTLTNEIFDRFSGAKSEICIMDPYITEIKDFVNLIQEYIHKHVYLKVITAKTESSKLKSSIEFLKDRGYKIRIIRYFDDKKISGRDTIIHDRYLIFDREKVIVLGKGINTILEYMKGKTPQNTMYLEILNRSEVKKFLSNFDFYFDYEASSDFVKNFPKQIFGD